MAPQALARRGLKRAFKSAKNQQRISKNHQESSNGGPFRYSNTAKSWLVGGSREKSRPSLLVLSTQH
jgi:hypothetical protein